MSNLKSVHILHLFPDLLNLYGDKGNIACLSKRLLWRGYDVTVSEYNCGEDLLDLTNVDIVFIGGGSDREQKIVNNYLLRYKEQLKKYVENNGVLIAICGGYQLIGNYYQLENERLEGLGLIDVYTEYHKERLIDNVILDSDLIPSKIVGFENHGGRTYIGNHTPLGKVIYGHGNDGISGLEGVHYKNVFATYLHGPLFPKNPLLCDYILTCALKEKYSDFSELTPLDDELETLGNQYIVERFGE